MTVVASQLQVSEMRKRTTFNPKRQMQSRTDAGQNSALLNGAMPRYTGNPEHKRNPGDFGLIPPSAPRAGKTLCDSVGIANHAAASKLLIEGFKRGLVSVQLRNGWPQNIWAVTEAGEPLESQLESDGRYHGYPMPRNDPFREVVLKRWETE